MREHSDYRASDIQVLTLRESVVRRPMMYFGDYAAADWPLVIAAWTASDLLDYAVAPEPRVEVILHRDGDLSAAVAGARVAWPVTARRAPVDELIRQRMWWHHLARSTAVVVERDGVPPGAGDVVGDELVWTDLDMVVRLTLDADLFGVAPQRWWHDGTAGLQTLFATERFRPAAGRRLTIVDEAAGTTTQLR